MQVDYLTQYALYDDEVFIEESNLHCIFLSRLPARLCAKAIFYGIFSVKA